MPTKKKETKLKSGEKAASDIIKKRGILSKNGKDRFPIVGIGASAGGLEAFESFFRNMPDNSGMAFVLVPHLDPKHASLMPELIQKTSPMKVIQIEDGTKVRPNCVYIVPPNKDLAMLKGTLQLMDPVKGPGIRMPIDYFFRSLAEDWGKNAIGIILSGMGTDGTLGLRALKGNVGMTMAQNPESAKYDSMPKSAMATGLVDFTIPPEKMPDQLIKYVDSAVQMPPSKLTTPGGKSTDALQKIFILLRSHTGHDFSLYKKNTIHRRIERRMNVHQIDQIATYVRYLQENALEVDKLFKELLIGVTSFFRDDEAFQVLQDKALSEIMEGKGREDVIRAWIPGCSSGEEAFSVAIILRETMEKRKTHFGVQVFATDIDKNAVETARMAIYPESISADVKPDRLKRFFTSENGGYQIRKDIRGMLIFAPQDIIKDPPFTKLDLICCRNLLIYLDAELQKRLLPLFHYSLKPGGILFLGSSETIGNFTDLFAPIDKKWKIYRRKDAVSTAQVVTNFPVTPLERRHDAVEVKKTVARNVAQLAEKDLLNTYAPPSVTINDRGDILYIHGRTGKYLEPAPGEAGMNVIEMAREGLKLELPSVIRKAAFQHKEVVHREIAVKNNGGIQTVNVTVRPVGASGEETGLWMVVFEDVVPPDQEKPQKKGKASKKKTDKRFEDLEKELQYTRENLQTTIEELETSNEELKSTNEELQSTNEELQSTNEELETSKEEHQSLNEELTTVNSELNGKLEELTAANNDTKNLFDSIEIPTVFLDNDLCVKRFTSHAVKVINLILTDIGRPVSDISTKLKYDQIAEEAKAVLGDLVFREKEVQTKDGGWHLMRILPYRTLDNVIDGVVVTFQDISDRKTAEKLRRLATVVEDSNDAIAVYDSEGNILAWNRRATEMYGWTEEEALHMNVLEIIPESRKEETMEFMGNLKKGSVVGSQRTQRMTKQGNILDVQLTVSQLVDEHGRPNRIATTERQFSATSTE